MIPCCHLTQDTKESCGDLANIAGVRKTILSCLALQSHCNHVGLLNDGSLIAEAYYAFDAIGLPWKASDELISAINDTRE